MTVAFLDANVFLDALLQRNEYDSCGMILKEADRKQIIIYTTAANLQNVIYFLSKSRIALHDIRSTIDLLLKSVSIVHTTEKIFLSGLHSGFTDLEDAIQYYTALSVNDMDYFITSNIKDYKKALPQLPVITPKQFIALQSKKPK